MYVKQKQTGQLGHIPDDQFDPSLYEQVTDQNMVGQLDAGYKQIQAQKVAQPQSQQSQQQQWQQAYNAASSLKTKNSIATGYKNAFGTELFAKNGGSTQDVSEVMKQGGSTFINKGKTKDERIAIAQEILAAGGIKEYRKQLPLEDLATDREKEGLEGTTDLLAQIDMSRPSFDEENLFGGTGPLAQYIPGFARSPEGREAVSTVEQVRAAYQQLISGKVVSEQEANRLKAFLPNKSKTETQNAEDLDRLRFRINLNLELFEKAKREGLTVNEAYREYGKEMVDERFTEQFGDQNKKKGIIETLTTPPSRNPGDYVARESLAAGLGPLAALGIGTDRQKIMAVPAVATAATLGGGAALKALLTAVSPTAIGQARDIAEKKAGDLDTSKMIQAGQRYVARHPEAAETWKVISKGIQTKATELGKQLSEWGPQTYTKMGGVRPNADAGLFKSLIQAGRTLVKEQAPEVAKQTAKFKFLHDAPKAAQRGLTTALKASAIGRLLGF